MAISIARSILAMLRFAEKSIDKIVINIFNKYVDNIPGKMQVRLLFCSRNIPYLSVENVEYFAPIALLALFQELRVGMPQRRPNGFTSIRSLWKDRQDFQRCRSRKRQPVQ